MTETKDELKFIYSALIWKTGPNRGSSLSRSWTATTAWSCPRDWRFSASWGPSWRPAWNPSNLMALWCRGCSRAPLFGLPLYREVSVSQTVRCHFFSSFFFSFWCKSPEPRNKHHCTLPTENQKIKGLFPDFFPYEIIRFFLDFFYMKKYDFFETFFCIKQCENMISKENFCCVVKIE